MSERSVIESKIKRKETEIQSLERKIKAAKIYLQALRDIQGAIAKDVEKVDSSGTLLRKGSAVAQARDIIQMLGVPVHIDDLIKSLGKEVTRESKASLTGSLAAYVRREEIFTRPAPNTYGLRELNHFEMDQPADEPPRSFGAAPNPSAKLPDFDKEIPF